MVKFIKKEWFFLSTLLLFFILYLIQKPSFNILINSIDWSTIRALFALMIITTAIKLSNFFDYLAQSSINKINDEKKLSLILIFLSFGLSMFLTNDITLFIVVPLTLSFAKVIKSDLTKLIIFEAIAVNVGSALTPFGNPQNLFILRQMDLSVMEFIYKMTLIVIPQLLLLVIFVLILFKSKKIEIGISKNIQTNKFLFVSSIIIFLLFLIALEFSFVRYVLVIIISFYFFTYKEVFFKLDYILLLTFILMFMDFYMLSNLLFIRKFILSFDLNFINIFNLSVILSQIFSNVPAAIFMSYFTDQYLAIAYGVNVAGNGLIIASLANFIAIRFIKNSKAYIEFHKYSLPFFILSYILIFLIIQKNI